MLMKEVPADNTNTRLVKHLRWGAAALVVAGALAAVLIYWLSAPPLPVPDLDADRGYAFAVERIGGKSALTIAQFHRWFSSLWHGTALAWTIAVLALLGAVICWWLAELMSYPMLPDEASKRGAKHEGD